MTAPDRPVAFVGRSGERAQLNGMLDRVRAGGSAAILLHGEAGIGKTTLLDYCARHATGCHVARIAGVPSELEMPYAGIHQLCKPMLGNLDLLPEPQKNALQVAFGLVSGTPPDQFRMGVAVLGLLAAVASAEPLVCLVDDAQWLDEWSRRALTFVGRRLSEEGVMLLLAERSEKNGEKGPLKTLAIAGLEQEDARALLKATNPGHLDDQVMDRIVAETRGNPLQLLELPRQMGAAELAGGFAEFGTHSAANQMEAHYAQRIATLPEDSRLLLLLAASDPTGDAALLWRAARRLRIEQDAAEPVREARLLTIGERVCFRHPLVRSAAYVIASSDERRIAHAALADSTDESLDPARRVWHLASGASEPDETIAAELVRAATTAESRAGLAAAAAFLERASSLTPDPGRRADRELDASEAYLQAGDLERARTLLAQSAGSATSALQLARVEQIAGQIDAAATSGREAPFRLLGAAKRLESLDITRSRATYLEAWWASLLAGPLAAPGSDIRTVSSAIQAAPAALNPGPADLLLDGLAAAVLEDPQQAVTSLRRGLDSFTAARLAPREWVRLAGSATTAAFALMDADIWLSLSAHQVELARESGALAALVIALDYHVTATTLCGDLRAATRITTELDAVKDDTGILEAPVGTHLLAAYRGTTVDAQSATGGASLERGAGYSLRLAGWAGAVFNIGFGRYDAALDACRDAVDQLLFDSPVVLAEYVEAAVRDGHPEEAREAYKRLTARAITGTDWATGIHARARALILDDDTAERFYAQSIDALTRTPLRPDLARSHLVYGEWLRRQNRVLDAREHLRIAYETFSEMGAEGFSERTRRELAAAGIKATRHGSAGESGPLTEQELQIARLAGSGSTNAEIATELFLSVRTVEWHLRKVFIKLGINARGDLKRALAGKPEPASSSSIAD